MRFVFTLLFLIPLYGYTQPVEFNYEGNKSICKCKKHDNIIDSLQATIASNTVKDERYLACCYHCLGVKYYVKNEYKKANGQYKKAIELRTANNDNELAKSYRNIGYSQKEFGLFQKAISSINSAIQLSDKEKNRPNNYIYLGECYTSIGEFEKAKNSLYTALQLVESGEDRAELNNTICAMHIGSQSYRKAIEYARKAITPLNSEMGIARAYNNKGIAHQRLKEYQKAIKSYNIAVEIYQKEGNIFEQAQTLNNVAVVQYEQNKYKEAITALNKSLQLKKKYYDYAPFKYTYAANHENLGEDYEGLDSIDKALRHYQLALQNLTTNFRQENIQQNPKSNNSNIYVYNKIDLIRILHLKASAAFKHYQQKGDSVYLNLAEKTYNTAFKFHNQLPQQITTQESRLFHAETIVPFIENALAVAYELQQTQEQTPETAYRFMEKNKATVLLQAINEARALQYAGLPDSLLEQEEYLRITITNYEKQLNDADQDKEKERIKNLLFEEKNTYDQFVRNLENKHPEYYNLKYKQNTTTLKDAQNYLDNETALLEYFVGDSSVYVLAIEKNTARLHRLDKPKNWNKTLNDFRKSTSDANTGLSFVSNAHQLYEWLLSKPLNELNTNIKRLQIIPDAQLNYLPFGLLLDSIPANPNYQNSPYLLKNKSISYAYSATLLLENQQQNQNKASYLYGGFAPKYHDDDLRYGRKNVEAQAQKIKGKSFLAEQATKTQFLNNADQFQILQLSMHGILNDEKPLYSSLIFANADSLYAADLYNTRLNADLAILSACNTGTGEIKKGEGVMSLSRAFTYAGCPSLLMSLWQVPDKGTADIMNTFLEQLQEGKTKDEALQTAQLNYLENTSPDRLHPMYWAGFVPSGNMQAVEFNDTFNWSWLTILILCVVMYLGWRAVKK